MCENRSTALAGDPTVRIQFLERWVNEDTDDPRLQGALAKWLKEVSNRIPRRRPLSVRLPKIFVMKLGLDGQRVTLNENGSITSREPGLNNPVILPVT